MGIVAVNVLTKSQPVDRGFVIKPKTIVINISSV